MLTLGLESTCDESSAALVESPRKILVNIVKSQIDTHAIYGGVVPEIASRLHLNYLAVAVRECLERANVTLKQVDLVAVSNRPGLLGGLLVGVTMGKTLSMLLNKPLILVDHLYGHIMAPDLVNDMVYPCVAGVFSGAHSNIYIGKSALAWEQVAKSRDDAPGEAFDKVAKLLGLPYPGGPALQKFAVMGKDTAYDLPNPCPASLAGDFSFSGLKTAVLYQLKGQQGRVPCPEPQWPNLAASFQSRLAHGLSSRLIQVALERQSKHIYVGGGVAANDKLREVLQAQAQPRGISVFFPPMSLCVDNGAMIAHAGRLLHENGVTSALNDEVHTRSNWGRAAV